MNGKVYHLHGIFIFVCVCFFSVKQPSCLKKQKAKKEAWPMKWESAVGKRQ